MSTPAVKSPPDSNLTPSEIVLLYCDRFAPPPRQSRIAFEIGNAWPYAMGMFFAVGLALAKWVDPSSDAPFWLRGIGGIAALALPVIWWRKRTNLDPAADREDVVVARPLGGTRVALQNELIEMAISGALLANEQAGLVELRLEDGKLLASFAGVAGEWPEASLEDQLRRDRTIPVSELVYDWLADGSHYPYLRAWRILEYNGRRRGLQSDTPKVLGEDGSRPRGEGEVKDAARVRALLDAVRTERPEVWKALRASIATGLKRREVPLRSEQVGRASIPKEWYVEAPLETLEAAPGPGSPAESTPVPKARAITWPGLILLTAGALGATAWALSRHHDNWTPAIVNAAIMAVGGFAIATVYARKVSRLSALRASYGLPDYALWLKQGKSGWGEYAPGSDRVKWADKSSAGLFFSALAAIPGAAWGPMTILIVLAALGLFWLIQSVKTSEFERSTAPEVVRARLSAMADAEAQPAEAAQGPSKPSAEPAVLSPQPAQLLAAPRIPDRPTPAHELPPPDPRDLELVTAWTRRWAAFRFLQWESFAVLFAGYLAIVLFFWNSHGDERWIDATEEALFQHVPVIPFFLLAATAMYLAWRIISHFQNRKPPENEGGQSPQDRWSVARLTAIWRVLILLTSPFLYVFAKTNVREHVLFFMGAMLLFLVAHWSWNEWEIRRVLRKIPIPAPRRLVLLRVFGSPAFDDLVDVIQPWRRVGCIEHLEGFDTVGESKNVLDALEAGNIDRALVKTLPEIEAQFAGAVFEPDGDLLFRRHAFQCTNTIWQEAVKILLQRADVVLMDLSSLCFERQGCAWELGQLLDRVPLEKITLLVNDNTDMDCLRQILEAAALRMPESSPNRRPGAAWQFIRIGGLAARHPGQSYYEWKRRLDRRLDSEQLAAWLLSTAGAPPPAPSLPGRSPRGMQQCGQARWAWLILLIVSASLAVLMSNHFSNP